MWIMGSAQYLLGIDPQTLKISISDQIRNEYGNLEGRVLKKAKR